jgi:hypothetical protein
MCVEPGDRAFDPVALMDGPRERVTLMLVDDEPCFDTKRIQGVPELV